MAANRASTLPAGTPALHWPGALARGAGSAGSTRPRACLPCGTSDACRPPALQRHAPGYAPRGRTALRRPRPLHALHSGTIMSGGLRAPLSPGGSSGRSFTVSAITRHSQQGPARLQPGRRRRCACRHERRGHRRVIQQHREAERQPHGVEAQRQQPGYVRIQVRRQGRVTLSRHAAQRPGEPELQEDPAAGAVRSGAACSERDGAHSAARTPNDRA